MAAIRALAALSLLALLAVPSQAITLSSRDAKALLAIKAAFTSYGSAKLSTWSTKNACAKWAGVTCSKSSKRVTGLAIPSASLKGRISSAVGNLTYLTTLNLSFNKLSGVIPESIGKLKNIKNIYLQYNTLTGAIPRAVAAFPYLVNLRLDNNLITGVPIRNFVSNFIYNVDFTSNYMGGDSAIKKNVRRLCRVINATRGLKYALNCLRFTSFLQPCYAFQRPSGECKKFCQANYYLGACGGHGQCLKSSKGSYYCTCDKGYKINKANKFQCV